MQIKLMSLDASEFKIQDGEVLLNGNSIVKTANVPILNGNKTLHELTQKKRELQALLSECRALYLADPSEKNENDFFNASAELNKVSKQLTEIEKQTLEFMSTVAEMTSDGKVLTYRQKEALKYFNQGDYDKAQAVLSDVERENELQRAENRAESAKNEIQGYVNEELLWIKTEVMRGVTTESDEIIREKYMKAIELSEKYDLDKEVIYSYVAFLSKQKDYTTAVNTAEKLKSYYWTSNIAGKKEYVAKLLSLSGYLYRRLRQYDKSERDYHEALTVYLALAQKKIVEYSPQVAEIYSSLAVLYIDTKQYQNAENTLMKAIELQKHLVMLDVGIYELNIADSSNILGILYRNVEKYVESEQAYLQAIEIYKKHHKNTKAYEADLAIIYNNLASLYGYIQRYDLSEKIYKQVLDIFTSLANQNPSSYNDDLAITYYNLGYLHSNMQEYHEAKKLYLEAIKIMKKLTERNPSTYSPTLEMICNDYTALLQNINDDDVELTE